MIDKAAVRAQERQLALLVEEADELLDEVLEPLNDGNLAGLERTLRTVHPLSPKKEKQPIAERMAQLREAMAESLQVIEAAPADPMHGFGPVWNTARIVHGDIRETMARIDAFLNMRKAA